eukprot:507119_1
MGRNLLTYLSASREGEERYNEFMNNNNNELIILLNGYSINMILIATLDDNGKKSKNDLFNIILILISLGTLLCGIICDGNTTALVEDKLIDDELIETITGGQLQPRPMHIKLLGRRPSTRDEVIIIKKEQERTENIVCGILSSTIILNENNNIGRDTYKESIIVRTHLVVLINYLVE